MAGLEIPLPHPAAVVGPLLPALPPAAISTQPPPAILPLLSPVLRQRVQLLSASSTEPWIRLLCYDVRKATQLAEIAKGDRLEPHPVSGEVEVDWDDAETRYRRLDQETLQALVILGSLGLAFQLVWCVVGNETEWKIGEVTVNEGPSTLSSFGPSQTVVDAERAFVDKMQGAKNVPVVSHVQSDNGDGAEDDDDGYWGRYDATPARTPAIKHSPGPTGPSSQPFFAPAGRADKSTAEAEDDYYSRYDSVQPAMDNHDPDEEAVAREANAIDIPPPPLGLAHRSMASFPDYDKASQATNRAWAIAEPDSAAQAAVDDHTNSEGDGVLVDVGLLHPRPASSAGSAGSEMVARLEKTAERQAEGDRGIRAHLTSTVRSLWALASAVGMESDEFQGIMKSELHAIATEEDVKV